MRILIAIMCLLAVGCQAAQPKTEAPDLTRTEAMMKQATCRVYSNNRFAGTGSLIRDDIVITAAHLFEGRPISGIISPTGSGLLPVHSGASIEVLFMPPEGHPNAAKPFPDIFKGISRTPAALILLNAEIDLAILSISPTGRTALKLARTAAAGQKIMAPSYKHGKELIFPLADIINITNEGIIYNASAGGGSSGGPIVNLQGELVGICKGPIEGGLKIMLANYKSIREWFGQVEKLLEETSRR